MPARGFDPAFTACAITALVLSATFVLAGGSGAVAKVDFGIFTAARLLHSFVYLKGKQPWRTIFFIVSGLALIGLAIAIVWLLLQGPAPR